MIRRNMLAAMALFCALCAAGCARKVNDQDAIRASIEKHLNARSDLNLGVMEREVKQVSVDGDRARAQVEFRLKGGGAGMEIEYALERKGDEWNVLSSQPVGMDDPHSGAGRSPGTGEDPGNGHVPPGHPPTN